MSASATQGGHNKDTKIKNKTTCTNMHDSMIVSGNILLLTIYDQQNSLNDSVSLCKLATT